MHVGTGLARADVVELVYMKIKKKSGVKEW